MEALGNLCDILDQNIELRIKRAYKHHRYRSAFHRFLVSDPLVNRQKCFEPARFSLSQKNAVSQCLPTMHQ